MSERSGISPSAGDIDAMARAALGGLPERFRRLVADVVLRVDEFPSDEICDDMGLESAFDLMGLYQGVSLDQKSVMDAAQSPDMIFLYRRPLLDHWCETGEPLDHLVRHVLVHEIGHHFGLSDADMEAIENST
jgi:predicted Zn-dependent protease with MMP-like domain